MIMMTCLILHLPLDSLAAAASIMLLLLLHYYYYYYYYYYYWVTCCCCCCCCCSCICLCFSLSSSFAFTTITENCSSEICGLSSHNYNTILLLLPPAPLRPFNTKNQAVSVKGTEHKTNDSRLFDTEDDANC